MKKLFYFAVFCFVVSIIPGVYADGIIIPPPEVQVAIKYHKVSVKIDNNIATTSVDQVFVNQSRMQIEGTYIFPLAPGVMIDEFIMYDESGKPLKAERLDSEQARKIYEEIVRSRRDPAILEYMGTGAFRARIFPILPLGEKRIQLKYSEILSYDAGIYRYNYPLNTEKFSSKPLEMVEVSIDLKSQLPIKSIWSPSHDGPQMVVNRENDNFARIVYADENTTPDKDFLLYYTVSDDDIGLNLLTYKEPSEDGFYVFMATPRYNISSLEAIGKNIIFVLDTSGSMGSGNKIEQAKEALEFCIRKLNKQDSFNIVDFSTGVRKFKLAPIPADTSGIQSALNYIKALEAIGSTDINSALLEALDQASRAKEAIKMIIFLTDGRPMQGVTNENEIIKNVKAKNKTNVRLFVFGVGYDVNTLLLDALAADNRGITTYVKPEEDIEIKISDFFTKVSTPVLSNLILDYGSINTVDKYPPQLPDLFAGSQLKEFGRYRDSGDTVIKLSGLAGNDAKEFTYKAHFPSVNTKNNFIPRIWASRKVGYLIEQARRVGNNPELIKEIRDLSMKYGIVNEYLSMLILEDQPPSPERFANAFGGDSGKISVDASVAVQGTKDAESVQSTAQGTDMKIAGSKIFIKKGDIWIDAEYKDKSPTIHLQYASNSYFNLLAKYPELGKYFALGKNVIVYYNGELYQVQDNPVETIKGDLDGSGVVDVSDLLIVAANFGKDTAIADVNEDGKVDIRDMILIVRYMVQGKGENRNAPTAAPVNPSEVKLTAEVIDLSGESLVMGVSASSVRDLYGFQFDIGFDPEIMEAVKIEEGTALSRNAHTTYWIPPRIDNKAGRITDVACVKMDISESAVNSSDVDNELAYITFKLKTTDFERAKNSVRIIDPKLCDPEAHNIVAAIDNTKILTQLWQNYPNPFNPETWIPYKLAEDSNVAIKIYDANGKLVRKLDIGHKAAGIYAVKDRAAFWDGKNSSGEEVSSGIYFYVLETGKFKSAKKMTLKK